MNLNRLLCPVDFSEASAHALAHAAAIGAWYHAKVIVYYVHLPVAANVSADAAELQREVENARGFAASAMPPGVDVDVIVDVGQPAPKTLARAAACGADMIVMGTHGTSGVERLLLGSVTEKVLRNARCPVLTVPPRARATSRLPFSRIVCPVDFSDSSLSALAWAWSLARESQAKVSLLHVIEWPWPEPPGPDLDQLPTHEAARLAAFRRSMESSSRKRLDALFPENVRKQCDAASLVRHGKAQREVLAASVDCQADLIVMGVHGRDPVDLTLFGSTTNYVVRGAACPVLTVRAPR
jgi:nucleotide-binding universal stress UspA family protein